MPRLLSKMGYAHGSPTMGVFGCAIGAFDSGKKEVWNKFVELYFDKILKNQNPDGSFRALLNEVEGKQLGDVDKDLSAAYATGFLALTLQLPEANLVITGGGKAIGCDMRGKEKIAVCTKCHSLLVGYRCPKCGKIFKPELRPAGEEGKKILVLDAVSQCPDCGTQMSKMSPTGTEIFSIGPLAVKDTCPFCNGAIKSEIMCAKNIYTCPNHPEILFLIFSHCPKCKKPLKLKETVYSNIVELFRCTKCGFTQESPGTCPDCKKPLQKREQCEMSGIFPHVDQKQWQERYK